MAVAKKTTSSKTKKPSAAEKKLAAQQKSFVKKPSAAEKKLAAQQKSFVEKGSTTKKSTPGTRVVTSSAKATTTRKPITGTKPKAPVKTTVKATTTKVNRGTSDKTILGAINNASTQRVTSKPLAGQKKPSSKASKVSASSKSGLVNNSKKKYF